jgi:hypothetical protein
MAAETQRVWRVTVVRPSRARAAARVWITNGQQREGWYPSEEKAQSECDKRNAALRTSGSSHG